MAITIKIIKKRNAEPARPVAPLVMKAPDPPKKHGSEWTPGPDDKPRPCKVCGHLYWKPCDGLNPTCTSARWYAQIQAGENPTLLGASKP